MQDLRVIGVENGVLLLATDDGDQFRLAVNDALHSRIRQAVSEPIPGRKIAPREVQAHIRSGLSAEEVASLTGVSLEYVRKFEGPVLAEREFVVESALNVPVHTALDTEPGRSGSTFGAVIRDRLLGLEASDERWASWKEAGGVWIVKLSFTANEIDHDARWQFEPKKVALAPMNGEANTLSQQGELPGGLIPRLRAVGGDERVADSSRFDSGAFDMRPSARDTTPQLEAVPFTRTESSPDVATGAINRAPADRMASSQTADLLDALRRRRGERESSSSFDDDESSLEHSAGSSGGIRIVDVPLATFDANYLDETGAGGSTPDRTGSDPASGDLPAADRRASDRRASTGRGADESTPPKGRASSKPTPEGGSTTKTSASARKNRASMPSWDDIVFGARSDDDLR